jgi:hypothetical protein
MEVLILALCILAVPVMIGLLADLYFWFEERFKK